MVKRLSLWSFMNSYIDMNLSGETSGFVLFYLIFHFIMKLMRARKQLTSSLLTYDSLKDLQQQQHQQQQQYQPNKNTSQ